VGGNLTTRLAWHELAWSDSKNDYGVEIKMATTNAICTYSFNVRVLLRAVV
jgi:hypothetical protein